ncbi:ATP-binding protein [Nonomuraea sp. NPDC050680]
MVVDLRVRDDGVGLDPADSERLFTRFVGRGFGPSPPSLPTAEPERRF